MKLTAFDTVDGVLQNAREEEAFYRNRVEDERNPLRPLHQRLLTRWQIVREALEFQQSHTLSA